MVNWNNPTTSTAYTSVLTDLKDRDTQAAKMDYSGDTNIPTNAIRYNSTTKQFEKYNGATWDAQEISNLADLDENIVYTANTFQIAADTSDGSDTKAILIGGGGGMSEGRGSYLGLWGADHATYPGEAEFLGNEDCRVGTMGAASEAHIYVDSTVDRFKVSNGYAFDVLGSESSSQDIGFVRLGGDRESLTTTSWVTLARYTLEVSQAISGHCYFAASKSGADAGNCAIYEFSAYYYDSGTATSVDSASVYSRNWGSSPVEWRINTSGASVFFEGRLSTAVGTYHASCGVAMGSMAI